jgi:sugar phosphate permease
MNQQEKKTLFYGWVVVWLAFFTMLVAYSLRYNFSVFYVAILEDFGWGRGETAAGFSVNLVVYAFSCPVAGHLNDCFVVRKVVPAGALLLGLTLAACSFISQIWQFYLIIGASAFGSCAMGYVPHVPMIANWFRRRRGLALGILSAGITASAIIAPVIQYLIATLGWKGAFVVLGGVSAFVLAPAVAIFQRQQPHDNDQADDKRVAFARRTEDMPGDDLILAPEWAFRDWTFANTVRTPRFWWLLFMCFFLGLYTYTFLTHQVAYLIDAGYSKPFAAGVVAFFSVLATISSVFAFVSDYLGREFTFTIGSGFCLIGVILLQTTMQTHNPFIPYLYALTFGFGFGLTIAMMAVTAADLFQGEHLGAINGMAMAFFVTGGALGPWLAGFIFDITGTYKGIFPLIYLAIPTSTMFIWLASPRKIRAVPGKVK